MQAATFLIHFLFQIAICTSDCMKEPHRTFHLIKRCQRSMMSVVELENVASLDDCSKVAKRSRALAFNYSPLRGLRVNVFEENQDLKTGVHFPRRSNRRHFLSQPEEFFNCHALMCPESSKFESMTNDSRFDYYSLYGDPPAPTSFTCLPEIGIFQLHLVPEKYSIAAKQCNKTSNGALAHVASELRTTALLKLLQGPGYTNGSLKLAYVGLNYTAPQSRSFKTSEKEDLNCFLYRAWAPGHPKTEFFNASCVALTTEATWMTIDCDRKLPYICEIYTSPLNDSLFEDSCEAFSSEN